MKKVINYFVVLFCLATFTMFTSCSKSNEHLIVGKWVLTSESNDGVNWHDFIGPTGGLIYEFKSDGTVTSMGFISNYSIEGDNLIISDDNYPYEIITLSHSEMIWKRRSTYFKLARK